MIETGLYAFLSGLSALTALVGTRIYEGAVAQGQPYPQLVYQRITTGRYPHLMNRSGLVKAMIQIRCWGESPESAGAVGNVVRMNLDGMRNGTMGAFTGVCITLEDERITEEPSQDGDDIRYHSRDYDFWLWHKES